MEFGEAHAERGESMNDKVFAQSAGFKLHVKALLYEGSRPLPLQITAGPERIRGSAMAKPASYEAKLGAGI